jgi:predicted AAA+ superfamily ATPase
LPFEYIESGGLPELFTLSNEETRRNYVSAVKDTVLLRNIIQRQNIKDAKLLEDILVYLVNNASNLVSMTNIVNYFKSKNRKTTYDTVSNYVGLIEDAFLLHKAARYDARMDIKFIPSGQPPAHVQTRPYPARFIP